MNLAYSAPCEHPPLVETHEIVIAVFVLAGGRFAWYIAREWYHMTGRQVAELACYLAIVVIALYATAYLLLMKRSRRERQWPHPPLVVRPSPDERATQKAWNQNAVVLGYDVHGNPWLWPDRVRVMQGIVLGMTGSGKTTLLRNIITQDLCRVVGPRGAWLEKRREAFLEATVKEPYFWYSVSVTAGMLLMMAAYTKLYLDDRRNMRVTSEMMAGVYSHDLLSRQAAAEAIERYNRHIEQCNRAIEASEAGDARPGWGETQVDSLKAELLRVAGQLEATTQGRSKLQDEPRQKSLIVADLSTRLDVLSKKINGPRDTGGGAGEQVSTSANEDGTRFVGQINRLQEELYTEQQKNNRLKGA